MDDRHTLPEDLILDILLRLHVESLLRLKCVCKSWYALIKTPTFIKKYFHHKNNRARLLVCNLEIADGGHAVNSVVFSLLPEKIVPGVTPEQKILLQLMMASDFTCVAGPVGGLFLVQKFFYGDGVRLGFLWNPATKEFWPLPPAPFEIEHFLSDHDHQFGLGFDLLTQEYKVVWIRVFWDEREQGIYPHVYACVYSSCNNSWKNLQPEFPSSSTLYAALDATYLNGVYYWLSRGIGEIYRIHSFDMGSEQFGEMQGPEIPSEHWGTLTLHGDSLAMLAGDPGKPMTSVYDMWVTKQEGSWSKVVTVQPRIDAHWPHNIWENDKMVFEITQTSQLMLYDPSTRQATDLGFQLYRNIDGCWVFNYKESLAPTKGGNEIQGQDNVVEQIEDFFYM